MTEVHLQDANGSRDALIRPNAEALGVGRHRMAVLVERKMTNKMEKSEDQRNIINLYKLYNILLTNFMPKKKK